MKIFAFLLVLFLCISSLGKIGDEVSLEKALFHVEKLVECSPRLAGSGTVNDEIIGGSYSAALYIYETLEEYGYYVEMEEFQFTTFQITEFILIIDFDGDFSTYDQLDLADKAIPPAMRYLDISYDIVAPLVLLEESSDIEGKIPVLDYWLYYDPEFSDIVGHSSISLVYKENESAFQCRFREAFSISYEDYLLIKQRRTPETVVWVKFSSDSREVQGFNVIGMKPGTEEKIILTAHYDSVYTDGAIDNGSGVAALLETARILADKNTEATLYFVFLDGEEIGLLGSEAFVSSHALSNSVCINVDSIASGDTVYIGGVPRYEEMWAAYYRTDSDLDSYVTSIAEDILGYTPERWHFEDVGGYSDFVSFMEVGVPSTDITTMDKEAAKIPAVSEEKLSEHATTWVREGKIIYYQEDRFSKVVPYIHTAFDDLEHFNKELFYETTKIVAEASYRLSREFGGGVELVYVLVIGMCAVMIVIWYEVRLRHMK